MISLSNYQQFKEGAGVMGSRDLDELKKALSVGWLRGGDPSSISGGALKLESLERTLKDLQFKEADLAMWMQVPKQPAFSTVEEYNRILDYGEEGGGFIGEGDTPEETDNSYERVMELVKYIGTIRSTTLQAQLVATNVGDLKLHQVKTGTKKVLRDADRALFKSDADIVPYEWNGFFAMHKKAFTTLNAWQDSDSVVDLRGSYLSEGQLETGVQSVIEHHGDADLLIAPTDVLSNFVKQYHAYKMIQPNTAAVAAGEMGQRVKKFHTAYGTLDIKYDKFMKDAIDRLSTDNATNSKAPAKPDKDGVTPVNVITDTDTRFGTAGAGDYFIGVAAKNRFGKSPIEMLSTSLISVASTESIDIKFAAGAGSYAANGYTIYMSEKNPATAYNVTKLYPVFEISVAQLAQGFDGGAAAIVRIKLRFIPNTGKAIIIEASDDVWSFKQLAPIMKMDLARVSTADRFMILLFGTPQLYAPRKMTIVINAGKYVAP